MPATVQMSCFLYVFVNEIGFSVNTSYDLFQFSFKYDSLILVYQKAFIATVKTFQSWACQKNIHDRGSHNQILEFFGITAKIP